jgi:hypothetical protein
MSGSQTQTQTQIPILVLKRTGHTMTGTAARHKGKYGQSSFSSNHQDQDDPDPLKYPSGPYNRRTEDDRFVVYAGTKWIIDKNTDLPVLPWSSQRMSQMEHNIGTPITDKKITRVHQLPLEFKQLQDIPMAFSMLNGFAHKLRVSVKDHKIGFVWARIATFTEQADYLNDSNGRRVLNKNQEGTILPEWYSAHPNTLPIIVRHVKKQQWKEINPVHINDVYASSTLFKTSPASVMLWGLYRQDGAMTLLGLCRSNAMQSANIHSYKNKTQGFNQSFTYVPDSDYIQHSLATHGVDIDQFQYLDNNAASSDYTPQKDFFAFNFNPNINTIWKDISPDFKNNFASAFIRLLENEPRTKLSTTYIENHYVPCLDEANCDINETHRKISKKSLPQFGRGTCRALNFKGSPLMPSGAAKQLWDKIHPLESDFDTEEYRGLPIINHVSKTKKQERELRLKALHRLSESESV